ncbi:MAG: hypothetical protein KDA44_00140 [Planctomycetales bacterium]|nr:hypothetical protein [Planctomycetales bacterium]MCB0825104.1 hypothetical protein [Armatimonadota bacterium]
MSPKPRIDEAKVIAATGHGWDHWFAILDQMEGPKIGHAAMAKRLREDHNMNAWWCQTVTIEYEIARGLRVPQQKTDGSFACSGRRKVNLSPAKTWERLSHGDYSIFWSGDKLSAGPLVGQIKKMEEGELIKSVFEGKSEMTLQILNEDGRGVVMLDFQNLKSQDHANEIKELIKKPLDSVRDALNGI